MQEHEGAPSPDTIAQAVPAQTEDQQAPQPRGTGWRQPQMRVGVVAALLALGVGIWYFTRPKPQAHVFGTLTLAAGDFLPLGSGCQGDGGYGDITGGIAVTVGGATGQTLAVGALSSGQEDANQNCVFRFDVPVAAGQSLYTVTISHRGTQTFSPDELTNGITLTLGS